MAHENVRQICKFNNSGFCKLGEQCPNVHVTELCSNNVTCKDKSCRKRHPRSCKFYSQNGTCKFENDCAYLHKTNESNKKIEKIEIEIRKLKEEIMKIGLAVAGMTVKLDEVIKNNKKECSFKCELCGYNASSATVLKSHLTRNHKQEILREYHTESSTVTSPSITDRDDNFSFASDSELEDEHEESAKTECIMEYFEEVLVNYITLQALEEKKQCDMCDYKNDNLAYLVVHMAKTHYNPNCQCCDFRTWLETSGWVQKLHN